MAEQQAYAEKEIIRQAQNGCQAAFGELYTHHTEAIYAYIHKRVGESCDAEDLTQTVFVKAWQALRDYQPSGAPFRAWLYRIAHNLVVDYYRSRRDFLFWDDLAWLTDPHPTPETTAVNQERQAIVHDAIAGLRATYQAVIVHRFLHNMDYNETAAALGHQVNNVRVLQHRALEALRQVLAQKSLLGLATMVTVMALLLGGKMVTATAQALPGDHLYPVRTAIEEARLLLADDATTIRLHGDFAAQRVAELQALFQQGRVQDMTAPVDNLSAHIQAASATLAVVRKTEAIDRDALTEQFMQTIERQSSALKGLTTAAPQTLETLQPAIDALTKAQISLQAQNSTNLVAVPTVPPTVIPTMIPTTTPAATVVYVPTPVANASAPSSSLGEVQQDAPTITQVESNPAREDQQHAGNRPALPVNAPTQVIPTRPSQQEDASSRHENGTLSASTPEEHPIVLPDNAPDTGQRPSPPKDQAVTLDDPAIIGPAAPNAALDDAHSDANLALSHHHETDTGPVNGEDRIEQDTSAEQPAQAKTEAKVEAAPHSQPRDAETNHSDREQKHDR